MLPERVVERVEPSPNFDERPGLARPDMIVLHYTGMQFAHEALERLRDVKARVSSHYLVFENGSVVQMVQEANRAWHAGVSSWAKDADINGRSIGTMMTANLKNHRTLLSETRKKFASTSVELAQNNAK